MNIKKDLKDFYDKNAKKYHETRKKHREEINLIINEISVEKKISILEFWCWWWRFIKNLNNSFPNIKINYTWIDISSNLIKIAKKENPRNNFICGDISEYIKNFEQESFDYIIWTESFQHIPSSKERFFLMKNFYRILKYDGKLIITNRCLSNRFIKKYIRNILLSCLKYIISLWTNSPRDILIPRKTEKNKIEFRFYHIFWLNELKNLSKLSWFIISNIWYIQKDNTIWKERKKSRTSILIASKKIFNSIK